MLNKNYYEDFIVGLEEELDEILLKCKDEECIIFEEVPFYEEPTYLVEITDEEEEVIFYGNLTTEQIMFYSATYSIEFIYEAEKEDYINNMMFMD